ncbi:MAG: 16S rRNA methyltransferase [Treponema sp.]|jgi:16S rRNA (cytosine1407-C5)-methyltransferase|nr:16S rRNA methyltransferase [Treponema sp.]
MVNRAFEAYYRNIYGSRWEALRQALTETPEPFLYTEGLQLPYPLDRSSVLAAGELRLGGAGLILDACAAPGGKSLVIASRMGEEHRLLANEPSNERRRRLVTVLDSHLSAEKRALVRVSGFNAAALAGKQGEHGRFAAILLDAPCSGERHIVQSEKYLAQWTEARPRSLAVRQWALLSAAFLLLRENASLVYATCSLNPIENDGVVSRLLKKYGGAVLDRPDFSDGEATEYGRIILPDTADGRGPLYVARFLKEPGISRNHPRGSFISR